MRRSIEALTGFIANQAKKTIRQPSRLILLPYRHLVRALLLSLGHLVVAIAWFVCPNGVAEHKMAKLFASIEADYQFHRGWRLLQEDHPQHAWRAFEACIKYSTKYYHFTIAGVCLHVGLGRMREAIGLYRQANQIRLTQRAASSANKYDRYCLLDQFWFGSIGHIANIDYVAKLHILEGRNPDDMILYVRSGAAVANRFLLEQWRPHLRFITDPRKLPFPEAFVAPLALDFYVPEVNGIEKDYLWELAARTYRRWAAEPRSALLRLPEETCERGRKALASAAVPPDAWFVALHVREPGYATHHRDLHGVLNANIADYMPAIREITQRGGWVIRMGDPSMTKLPPIPNVLDYSHSAIRSDWMDVFLAAACRFFIGTSSGVCYVAQDYGVPCVLTNWWPPAQRPWHAGDIFVPKILRREAGGQILSLEESLHEPFGYCNSKSYLREQHGAVVEANDPEDICCAVVEMLERFDGSSSYEKYDLAARKRAEIIYASVAMKLYDSQGGFGAAALARDFLRRNPSFVQL